MLSSVPLRGTVRNSTGNHKKLYGKSKFLHKERFFTLVGYGVLLVTECEKVGYKPEFVINSIAVVDDGELSVVLLIVFRAI
ncbi:hypothetical protein GAA09_15390 [Bacteroides salyersiae]|nr:hypothetical protein GAA09_15390 [Bacteroides salyersiae]KAB5346817.1 hypothetical protein F9965_06770 [Bacteroides salyersiae]KAB5359427.1 hypothetical protein F9998_12140 [Bacteroides salyersiae]